MRHRKKKKFGHGMDQKRKLLRSLASSAILYERIETTHANARAVKPYLEKLITRAKEGSLHNRRILLTKLTLTATKKIIEVLGPKYKERKGGYTRLIKLINPKSGSSKTVLELVD